MANTFNPYPVIGTQLTNGLDSIVASVGATPTVDEFVTAIYNYIHPIYYPGASVPTQIQLEIKSVAYNIINAYNNGAFDGYSMQQMKFIALMIGPVTTNSTPVDSLGTWLADIEDNISKSKLNIENETPLLLSIESGRAVYDYWITQVGLTPSAWAAFFNTNAAINYANIRLWTAACMGGAIIGAKATPKGLITPTTDIVTVNIISSLIGALAIGAGTVIYKWVPRIQPATVMSGLGFQSGLMTGTLVGGFGSLGGGSIQFAFDSNSVECTNKMDCSGTTNDLVCHNELVCPKTSFN